MFCKIKISFIKKPKLIIKKNLENSENSNLINIFNKNNLIDDSDSDSDSDDENIFYENSSESDYNLDGYSDNEYENNLIENDKFEELFKYKNYNEINNSSSTESNNNSEYSISTKNSIISESEFIINDLDNDLIKNNELTDTKNKNIFINLMYKLKLMKNNKNNKKKEIMNFHINIQ